MPKRDFYDDGDDEYRYPRYPASRPIAAPNGIRAKTQRGRFATSWWGDRWIEALESLMDPARLTRGRSYARRGQVVELSVTPGLVIARVQGSRPKPYSVQIRLKPLAPGQWDQVLHALAEQAVFSAQLLAGEMPRDIVDVFEEAGIPLFPEDQDDLRTDCSCPDWANPCKHIAAVYYLLAERFDADPFLLLELRGRGKDQITCELRALRAQESELEAPTDPAVAEEVETRPPSLEELKDHHWELGKEADALSFDISIPDVEGALLRRLGTDGLVGLARYESRIMRALRVVSARAVEAAYADSVTRESD